MDGLIHSTVEGGVVLVLFKTQERYGDAAGSCYFIDSALDLESRHGLHLTCPDLEDGVALERREEVNVCRRRHGSAFFFSPSLSLLLFSLFILVS